MKNISRRTVKSITRNALIISMVLHLFFLITLFYFSVSDQSLLSFQDKIAVTLSTAPKPPSKMPMKPPIRQQRQTATYDAVTPIAKIESINPHIAFQPRLAPTEPVITEQPRLKQTNTAPDVKVNISTALNELRQVENGLSKTEAAEPTIGSSFGSKRSGMLGVQRTPTPTKLDIGGTIDADDDIPTIADLQEKKPPLPYIPFGTVMENIAREIVETSNGGPIDVVFVIDASGSMGDNIEAVAEHLTDMIDVYKSSDIDYALGLTQFSTRHRQNSRKKQNDIEVFQLTQSLAESKRNIHAIVPRRDENALDAIAQTVNQMRFRATSKKHLILVTDEPFTSLEGLTIDDSIALCREFGIYVNVLGLPNENHRLLASATNGKWHAIPKDPKKRQVQRRNKSLTEKVKTQLLRKTHWRNVQKISKTLLRNSGNTPVDVVLFIDGSKSMEDKLPQFLQQLNVWVLDWEKALIDYQIGVVRFRTRASVDIVNVFNPPQSLDQIHKIVELPCRENENLLHAITEGLRRIKLRPDAQIHLILVTDEPVSKNSPSSGVIQFLEEKQAVVSVVGTFDDFQEEVTIKTGGVWVPIPEGHTTNHMHW
ncbi:VWA domain-containing protein [Candidatus Poribacteria bacterium]|nr:VWA domain-containing protein [Candidatus Poribacteria bacterium]